MLIISKFYNNDMLKTINQMKFHISILLIILH